MPNLGRGESIYDAQRVLTLALDQIGGGAGAGAGLLLNRVLHFDADIDLVTPYQANQLGLMSALNVAAAGDTVWLPSRTITLTAALTIPAGVTLAGIVGGEAYLSFSGFSGVAITLNIGSRCINFALDFVANGGASCVGIDGRKLGTWIESMRVRVRGATAENIAIYTGAGTLTRNVWFTDSLSVQYINPNRLYWSANFFNPEPTVWQTATLPAGRVNGPGGSINGFDIALDESVAYLLGYTSATTGFIWKTTDPRSANPTWTIILSIGDSIGGGALDGIGQLLVHGSNLYCLARTSTGGRFHGKYDGVGWTWTAVAISPNDPRNEVALPTHWTKHFSPNSTLYNLAGGVSHSWAFLDVSTPSQRNNWQNRVGGPIYLLIALPGDPGNTSRIRNTSTGVDLISGLIGNPRQLWLRGPWDGAALCIVEKETVGEDGHLKIATNGVNFTEVFEWKHGICEPASLTDLSSLVWIAQFGGYAGGGDPIIRLSEDTGASWTDKTGNFWSVGVRPETTNFMIGNLKVTLY